MMIVGAGMAGLLAANMLRRELTAICESQPELPHNHSAVLRFRGSAVGDVLGIPFKKVKVMKAVDTIGNPVADSLSYSKKTNGTYSLRSIITANGEVDTRYVAPPDLVAQMASMVDPGKMWFNSRIDFGDKLPDEPIISTIPMPTLMMALGWSETPDFQYVKGLNIKATISNADAYVSLYEPHTDVPWYRASITGNELVVEVCGDYVNDVIDEYEVLWSACRSLGIDGAEIKGVKASKQAYAKIQPIDDDARKRFILWATEKHNIYSLGRFATWRPGLLLDDVVEDVRHIQSMIHRGHTYDNQTRGNK